VSRLRRAIAVYGEGDLDGAEALLEGLSSPDAAHMRGLIAHKRGDLPAAEAHIQAALAQEDDPSWRANLGIVYIAAEEYRRAAAHLQRALRDEPGMPDAYCNLSVALLEMGRFQKALEAAATALSLKPEMPHAYNNLGAALQFLGRLADARAAFEAAVDLEPDEEYLSNLGILDLLEGDTEPGWARYEARRPPTRPPPRWEGEPLLGRPLLLFAEQGMGDTIQFSRFASLLSAWGETVWLEVPVALRPLLGSLPGRIRFVSQAEGAAAHRSIPLMSLPNLLGPVESAYPASVPYLSAEPDRVARWRSRLPQSTLRVGICWQGNPDSRADLGRSFPLSVLTRHLGDLPGVTLISLQKGPGEEQLDDEPMVLRLPGLDDDPGAFRDTAAVMESLELVITADTSVAHLAGALARPVWIALQHIPDWRWQLHRRDAPWYPTARLFRQLALRDWDGVFAEMRSVLVKMVRSPVSR